MKHSPELMGSVLLIFTSLVPCQGQYAFSNLAGWPGGAGNADGIGSAARFGGPSGIGIDSVSNLYVANYNTVRKLSSDGSVTTFAGNATQTGSSDGTGIDARFNGASDVTVDGNNYAYVADTYNHTIRKLTPSGLVSTLAGSPGQSGTVDGTGNTARFNQPFGVAADATGNVYVADYGNHTIRKITPGGVVTTVAGMAGQSGSADGTGGAARLSYPSGVALDKAGNLFVADSGNHTIRKVTPARVVTTLAGMAGQSGSADGTGSAARFTSPVGISLDDAGFIYVADLGNQTIRKLSPSRVVTTLAGSPGQAGSVDGTNATARFSEPCDVCVDHAGNLYVADRGNSTIRQVSPTRAVTTVAGSAPQFGATDAIGNVARFYGPKGVAVDANNNVYVADSGNHLIRKIEPNGLVTTLAGKAGQYGSSDGSGSTAQFFNPTGVAVDDSANVYVADRNNETIRKISPLGVVTTLAGSPGQSGTSDGTGAAARFSGPEQVAVDAARNVYLADSDNHTIRKVTPLGAVTTLAGNPGNPGSSDGGHDQAHFNFPSGVAVDPAGNVYVADTGNQTIRKVTSLGLVTTLAGSPGQRGSRDGTGNAARFNLPSDLAVDPEGNVYVTDSLNYTIRKVTPDAIVTTIAGVAGVIGAADGIGSAAQFTDLQGIAIDHGGNLLVADNNRITKGTTLFLPAPYLIASYAAGAGPKITASGLRAGATVVWESSNNLGDWVPIQTNVASDISLDFSPSNYFEKSAEFIRALVK